MTGFASSQMAWRESTEEVRRAWAKYRAETGEGRKAAATHLHIDNAKQNIIIDKPLTGIQRKTQCHTLPSSEHVERKSSPVAVGLLYRRTTTR